MKKLSKRIHTLLRNINYLSKHVLWEDNIDLRYDICDAVREMYLYEIKDEELEKPTLHILNADQSLDLLLETRQSFCRFGDGEIEIMRGGSIAFQQYSQELAQEMMWILGGGGKTGRSACGNKLFLFSLD